MSIVYHKLDNSGFHSFACLVGFRYCLPSSNPISFRLKVK